MKWCSYCRKADHTDAECWCTRAVQTTPADPMCGMSLASTPPLPESEIMQRLRAALASRSIAMPSGLSVEEKRQFILFAARP